MKPDWCSQDTWDSAFYHMDDFALVGSCADDDEASVQQAIARAIMAEREACAEVADYFANSNSEYLPEEVVIACGQTATDIASTIRNRP